VDKLWQWRSWNSGKVGGVHSGALCDDLLAYQVSFFEKTSDLLRKSLESVTTSEFMRVRGEHHFRAMEICIPVGSLVGEPHDELSPSRAITRKCYLTAIANTQVCQQARGWPREMRMWQCGAARLERRGMRRSLSKGWRSEMKQHGLCWR
jgi:hypothetical protein